jgi:hypothetical protein
MGARLEPVACRSIAYGQPRGRMAWLVGLRNALGIMSVPAAIVGVALGQLRLLPLLLPWLAVAALVRWLRRREHLGTGWVFADERGLRLEAGGRRIELDHRQIVWGAARDAAVDFETRDGRRVALGPADRADVDRLLEATGTAVDQRTLTLPLRGELGPATTAAGLFTVLLLLTSQLAVWLAELLGVPGADGIAFLAAMAASGLGSRALTIWLARPSLTVGIDGVLVRRFGRRRFIAHDAIESVSHATGKVLGALPRLDLRLGSQVLSLPIVGWGDDDVARVTARIGKARSVAGTSEGPPTAAFARQGMAIADWRAALRRLLSADRGFRQHRITADQVRRVLADPAVALEQRVGAALALREVDPERGEERIRFAAEAAADRQARDALLATLVDDETTEAALGAHARAERSR